MNCVDIFRERTMKLLYFMLIGLISVTKPIVSQDDDDFNDIDKEDFEDVPQTHFHDHDDDGSFEARRSLERVSFIVFCKVVKYLMVYVLIILYNSPMFCA